MKLFYLRHNIGKAKYVVRYYDGVKTHRDGSTFYDIAIFKNKIKRNNFVNELIKSGYKERGISLHLL